MSRGFSPIEKYGWRHSSRDEAMQRMADCGGLAVLMNRAMRMSNIQKTVSPRAGDVGLVIYDGRMCIGIHTGTFWFSRHEDGLIAAPLNNVWKAWRICED